MKPNRHVQHLMSGSTLIISLAFTLVGLQSARASTITWDGGGVGGTDIGAPANWAGDVLPSVITPDTAQWDGSVAGPLSLVYADTAFAGAPGNPGIDLHLVATQLDSVNIDSGANIGTLRVNNVTVEAAAFSLGNSLNVFNVTLGGVPGTHTWTNNSGSTAVIASDVAFGLGGGGTHTLAFAGLGNWTLNNVISNGGGTLALAKSGAGTTTITGVNTFTGGTTLNAGTLNINNAAALGNVATGGLVINGGTIDNTTAGAIVTTTAKAQNWNGNFAFTGTQSLSFNGGVATIGGTSGESRQVNVGAGSLAVGNILGQTSNVGGLGYGLTKTGAGTLTMSAAGSPSNITGELNVSGGTINTAGDLKVGGLTGGGTITNNGSAEKWFFVGNGVDNTFSGVIQNGTFRLGLNKTGIGTLTLTGTNTYTARTTLNGGTIEYGSSSLPGITQALSTQATTGLVFAAGDGVIKSSSNGTGTASLTFGISATRTAGATGNFVVNGGVNGSTNSINLTRTAGFVDKGMFFNGENYAWMNGTNTFVRGIDYTTDGATVATSGTTTSLAAIDHQEITGAITAQNTATFNTLKNNGNNNITLAADQTVTVSGILKTGNVAGGATISGGTGIQAPSGAEMVIRANGVNDALTISSPILANGANALTKSGEGTVTLSGANAYTGTTTVNGGTLVLSGSGANGALVVTAGTLTVSGTLAAGNAITVGKGASNSRLNIQTGANINKTILTVGGNSDAVGAAVGAVHQTGGALTLTGTGVTAFTLGTSVNGYGYYGLSGGSLTVNEMGIGSSSSLGTVGVMDVTNSGSVANSGWITIGRGAGASSGTLNINGGSVTALRTDINWAGTAGGQSVVNVANGSISMTGSATLGLNLASANIAGTLGVANLLSGGTMTTGIVTAGNANPTALLNFNGGILKATSTNGGVNFLSSANIDGVYVYSGGGTIDNSNTPVTIGKALLAPTGSGVSSINVSGGSGYVGAPMVTISGGGGTGATGYATLDSNGNLTGIVMTNRGTGYTSTPTVSLVGGGGIGATVGTVVTDGNTSGGMTFSGSGVTTLSGISTYTGATLVSAGTLLVNGSLADTAVTVQSGATIGGTNGTIGAGFASVTVDAGGTLAPGSSIGALTVNGNVTVNGTFGYEYNGGTNTGDVLDVNGTLTLNNATLSLLDIAGDSYTLNDKFTLAAYDFLGVGSLFSGYADDTFHTFGGGSWLINYNDATPGSNGGAGTSYITVTAIPEPASILLGSLGLFALLRRRRNS